MKLGLYVVCLAWLSTSLQTQAQDQTASASKPAIAVRLLPPYQIVSKSCANPNFGILYSVKDKREVLDAAELGMYILSRMRDGYVVRLYPQTDSKIWTVEECPKSTDVSEH